MYCAMLLLESLIFYGLFLNFAVNTEGDLAVTSFNSSGTEEIPETHSDGTAYNDLNSESLSICDITKNYCDINCCNDKDCTSFDLRSFNCSHYEAQNVSPFAYDNLYCYNRLPKYLKHPSTALCFELENSPYLGRFFKEDNIIHSRHDISELLKSRTKIFKYFKEVNEFQEIGKNKKYLPQEFMLKIFNEKGYFREYLLPTNIMGTEYCSNITPLKVIDQKSNCLLYISREQCKQATQLQMIYEYFNEKFSLLSDFEEKTNDTGISMKIMCSDNGSNSVVFFESHLKYSFPQANNKGKLVPCGENVSTNYNEKNDICENLIVALALKFIWNYTDLIKMEISAILADIPLSIDNFRNVNEETMNTTALYVSQSFTVEHQSVSTPYKKKNFTKGYSFGNRILLSNLSILENTNCSSSIDPRCSTKESIYTVWTEGDENGGYEDEPKRQSGRYHNMKYLSVGVGADCQIDRPIEFGYDTLTKCTFKEENDCDPVRFKIKEALQKLLQSIEGVDDGLGSVVPHIRNNEDNVVEVEVNTTKPCEIVKHVQFQVLYVPLLYRKSRNRILGFYSRLENSVCNLEENQQCELFWSVLFRRAEPKSDASRWTLYMTSRIGESYSWYNIFKGGPLTSYHNHESFTFKLLVTAAILLIILRRYY